MTNEIKITLARFDVGFTFTDKDEQRHYYLSRNGGDSGGYDTSNANILYMKIGDSDDGCLVFSREAARLLWKELVGEGFKRNE